MIAKITVHGATRSLALSRLRSALSEAQVAGTTTNLTFLGKLAEQADFASGDVDTGLIERNLAALIVEKAPRQEMKALAVLAAAGVHQSADWPTGFSIWSPLRRTVSLVHRCEVFTAVLELRGADSACVELGDEQVDLNRVGDHWVSNGQRIAAQVIRIGDSVSVFGEEAWHFEIPDPLMVETEGAAGGNVVPAPMPGLVRDVFVIPGDEVAKGGKLAVLEAMKMEHILTAPRDGVVAEVLTVAGAQVEAGVALIRLKEDEE